MDFDKSWSRQICEWNSSSQLWHCELQFLVAREGRQPQWCVSRIFKICRGKSRAKLTSSNNAKTKVEPSSMHRETVASTIRVAPASSKSSSGGSGSSSGSNNPTSIHLKAKSIYVKKEIPKEDRIWTTIPGCQKCKRDSFETRISKCVTNFLRHHGQDERETDGAMHWDVILPVLKGDSEINWRKSSRMRIGSIAFILAASRQGLKSVKMKDGELRFIRAIQGHSGGMLISPKLMNYVMLPYKWKRFIYHVGRAGRRKRT